MPKRRPQIIDNGKILAFVCNENQPNVYNTQYQSVVDKRNYNVLFLS